MTHYHCQHLKFLQHYSTFLENYAYYRNNSTNFWIYFTIKHIWSGKQLTIRYSEHLKYIKQSYNETWNVESKQYPKFNNSRQLCHNTISWPLRAFHWCWFKFSIMVAHHYLTIQIECPTSNTIEIIFSKQTTFLQHLHDIKRT